MQNVYLNQVNNIYPDNTAGLDPKAPEALANAFADVLFLPHNAVSISSYNYVGYSGSGIGGYSDPSTTATLTVLYQGTGLIPSVNAVFYAFREAISAVNSQKQSPLGNALIKYGFPNAYTVTSINGNQASSKSYTAGQPTPAPTTYSPPTREPTSTPTVFTPPTRVPTPAPTKINHGTTTLNATSVGDNVTTISHLNYQPGEDFYWYIKPPFGPANGTKLTYAVHFSLFGTDQWDGYLYVGPMGSGYQGYCARYYCTDIQFTSTTGVTLYFTSYSWISDDAMSGFIAKLTWQIYKPRKLLLPLQLSTSLRQHALYIF